MFTQRNTHYGVSSIAAHARDGASSVLAVTQKAESPVPSVVLGTHTHQPDVLRSESGHPTSVTGLGASSFSSPWRPGKSAA